MQAGELSTRWNTREDPILKKNATVGVELRVRLWLSLQQLVPQGNIPEELQIPQHTLSKSTCNKENSSIRGQEHQRAGSAGPTPNSPQQLLTQDGLCEMYSATYLEDSVGNVVSPAAVSGTICFASVDHVFPYSRGGLSKPLRGEDALKVDSNYVLMQHVSNKLKDSDLPQEHVW